MSNYYNKIRTNYFSVTNVEKFKEIIAACKADDEITIFDEKQPDGGVKYGLFCSGRLLGFPETDGDDDFCNEEEEFEDADYSWDAFREALQHIIPPGDAVIVTEVGSEAMRYLVGSCTVITHDDINHINIRDEALKLAGIMLENPEFTTKMEY